MKTNFEKLVKTIKWSEQDGEFFTKYGKDKWVVIDRVSFNKIMKMIKEALENEHTNK